MVHSRRSSPVAQPDAQPDARPALSGTEVTSFLQPLLVDLIVLVLHAKQAEWHLHGRHLPAIRGPLRRLVTDVRLRSDDVALRMVMLGGYVDVRPATVATTTGLPDLVPGFVGEVKTLDALVGQIDAAVARARNAVWALGPIDQASRAVVRDVLRDLERSRWELTAQVPSQEHVRLDHEGPAARERPSRHDHEAGTA
jgi:starvation-inducible DNA-binding protein